MRPIETLLSLANLLTFFVLAIPRLREVFWIRYWALIALLTAVTQLLVEGGPRWQMVPAYALAGLFFLVWLLRNIVPLRRPVGQILNNRAHDIINAYSLAFFDRHLNGQAGALLNGPAEQYPEILFETRRP